MSTETPTASTTPAHRFMVGVVLASSVTGLCIWAWLFLKLFELIFVGAPWTMP